MTVAPGSSRDFTAVAETQTMLRAQEKLAADLKRSADHGLEVAAGAGSASPAARPAAPATPPAPAPPPAPVATPASPRAAVVSAPAKTPSVQESENLPALTWSAPGGRPAQVEGMEEAAKYRQKAPAEAKEFEKTGAAQQPPSKSDQVLLVIHILASPTSVHEGAAADQAVPPAATETGK